MDIHIKNRKITYFFIVVCMGTISYTLFSAKPLQERKFDVKRALQQSNIIPVAIIGSGPAGLCAAIYTARDKLPTYIYTDGNIGGYLNEIKHIENMPGFSRMAGAKIAEKLQQQVESFGAQFIHDKVVSVDLSSWPYTITTQHGQANALSIIVATGFSPKKPEIPGVDTYWGLGVSTCTLCDAPFHKDQEVVVVGGDDYAAERALQLAAYAKKVTMVIKEPQLIATAIVQDYLRARPNITMLFHAEITKILGDGKQVTQVEIYDSSQRKSQTVSAQGVYVNSLYVPNSEILKGQVAINSQGYITLVPGTQRTSVKGVFAAGTVADPKYRKALTACGDGAKAAMEAIEFMHKKVGYYETDTNQNKKVLLQIDSAAAEEEIPTLESQKDLRGLLAKHRIVIIYFYRLLCPYCQETVLNIRKVKTDFGSAVHVVKANAHTAEQLARDIDVDGVPYVVIYKDGVIERRLRGVEIKDKLHSQLEELMQDK